MPPCYFLPLWQKMKKSWEALLLALWHQNTWTQYMSSRFTVPFSHFYMLYVCLPPAAAAPYVLRVVTVYCTSAAQVFRLNSHKYQSQMDFLSFALLRLSALNLSATSEQIKIHLPTCFHYQIVPAVCGFRGFSNYSFYFTEMFSLGAKLTFTSKLSRAEWMFCISNYYYSNARSIKEEVEGEMM